MNNSEAQAKPSFVVVGCGKVGASLARHLSLAGYPAAAMVSRSKVSAERTARLSGAPRYGTEPANYTAEAGMVLITTPDGAIEETCRQIADQGGFASGAVVLHCSGALPSTILAPAREAAAFVGSLHPLQSFASISAERNPFRKIIFAVEGDAQALVTAEAAAHDLGGKSLRVKTEAKGLYHAAAVAASNYLVSLVDMAFSLLASAGISEEQAPEILTPLIEGTLANIRRLGPPRALTGPIARNDHQTVLRHLGEMRRFQPQLEKLYAALGRHTVDVARRGGHLAPDEADDFLRLFAAADPTLTE